MTVIYDEIDKTYVNGWDGNEFTFTKHKGLAQTFVDDASARKAVRDVDPTNELIGYRLIVVRDTLTPEQAAVAAMLKLTPEQRKDVFSEFCLHCGTEDSNCTCWRDE